MATQPLIPRSDRTPRRPRRNSFRPVLELLEGRTLLNAGTLDPTFATGGVFIDPALGSFQTNDIALQGDGKILAAQGSGPGSISVLRANADGSLDTSFGPGGRQFVTLPAAVFPPRGTVTTGSSGGDLSPTDVLWEPDGKIVVTGSLTYAIHSVVGGSQSPGESAVGVAGALLPQREFFVIRLNPDGSPDASFGTGGAVLTKIGNDAPAAAAVLEPDGSLVVAGTSDGRFALARYDLRGALDPTFGTGGIVITPLGTGAWAGASSLAVAPGGKLVEAGVYEPVAGTRQAVLVRYDVDGTLDATFGAGGVVNAVPTADGSAVAAVAVDEKGRVVVAALVQGEFVLERFTAGGIADTGFGTGGAVHTGLMPYQGYLQGARLALQADGKVLLAAENRADNHIEVVLARYTAGGVADLTFGDGGRVATTLGMYTAFGPDLALQGDGRIVLAADVAYDFGTASPQGGAPRLGLARFDNDAPPLVPPLVPADVALAVSGSDAGHGPQVEVRAARTGALLWATTPYDPRFTGGVRTAVGDVNRDGIPDVIAAAGPGGGPNVIVYSGADGSELYNFMAFDPDFTGGLFVAAGDVNGDGSADIIVGADAGGGPNVSIFSGRDGSRLASYFAYDPRFTGGVRVSAGDVMGTGEVDVICGAGAGGGPNVTVFRGTDGTMLASFFAYDPNLTVGITVAAGNAGGTTPATVTVTAGDGSSATFTFNSGAGGFSGSVPNTQPPAGEDNAVGDDQHVTTPEELDAVFAADPAWTGGLFVQG